MQGCAKAQEQMRHREGVANLAKITPQLRMSEKSSEQASVRSDCVRNFHKLWMSKTFLAHSVTIAGKEHLPGSQLRNLSGLKSDHSQPLAE